MFGQYLPPSDEGGRTFKEFVLRTTFTFTQAQLDAFQCTGSRSIEVDVQAYGGMDGGLPGWDSNLPGAYLDTEAYDKDPNSRTLTVGSSEASKIEPNKEYFAELRLLELTIKDNKNYAELYLNLQRGHWASSTKEKALCLAHGNSDPAWCINPDPGGDVLLTKSLGGPLRVQFDEAYPVLQSGSWGSYQRTELSAGSRINSGDRLYSPNREVTLTMQPDGNLVEYVGGVAVWSSDTHVPESILIAQPDGNLAIVAPGNRPVWSTGVRRQGTVYQLQNDQNFVAYAPGHGAVWSNEVRK